MQTQSAYTQHTPSIPGPAVSLSLHSSAPAMCLNGINLYSTVHLYNRRAHTLCCLHVFLLLIGWALSPSKVPVMFCLGGISALSNSRLLFRFRAWPSHLSRRPKPRLLTFSLCFCANALQTNSVAGSGLLRYSMCPKWPPISYIVHCFWVMHYIGKSSALYRE